MKKIHRFLSLFLIFALALSLAACKDGADVSGKSRQRTLSIIWPSLGIEFYAVMADTMKNQAEEAGWKVDVVSFDFDSAVQTAQLENCVEAGTTDIITCALDPDAIEDVCIRLRQQGINISMFAMAPDNPDAYDSVTVADQYRIGEAIAQNASDWVNDTFPDAADGSVDAVLIEVPADEENSKRDRGMETIADNPKINVVYTCELPAEDPAGAKKAVDRMMEEYPDTKVVLCHFASLALAADTAVMDYSQIDREHFGIFSGDWEIELANRIQASVKNESLIRATGTYAIDAMELQFHVCTGEYNRLLNEQKQYVYPIVRITPKNIGDYLE